jgi:hypothetical protein
MAITIELPEETERILAARASEYGQTLETFVAKVLIREARKKSLDEVLAPFRKEFEESGMTEEELGDLIQEARREIWQEKHGNPSKIK